MGHEGERARSALLIIDMLSDYRFPGGEALAGAAVAAAPRIRAARDVADARGIPVVYANDIVDDWSCSPDGAVERAWSGDGNDAAPVHLLAPRRGDAFMHKGQHSAFFGTPLAHYLVVEEITEVVLTGQVTEQCVLYTALDAHVRHHDITVIDDAVVSTDPSLAHAALRMMAENMDARVIPLSLWDGPA